MKLFVCVLGFACGLVSGSALRFTATAQAAYSRGVADGLGRCHREAALEGAGYFDFPVPGDNSMAPSFRWFDHRPDYNPESRVFINGALDN